jgi:hypothetical protein
VTVCRFNGHTNPRLLNGHHHEQTDNPDAPVCPNPDTCRGCAPCPDNHCAVCSVEHTDDTHPVTCPECVAAIRDDLKALPGLCVQLRRHARLGNSLRLAAAPIPGGEATVMIGPATKAAHSRAYYEEGHRPQCTNPACKGCLDASHKADEWDGDANTPMLVLVQWEDAWRDTLGSPTQKRPHLRDAIKYLGDHLTLMAQRHDPPIGDFAEELATLRHHLEEVLGDGVRNQPGAPCVHCGTALVQLSSKPRACKHRVLADEVAKLAKDPRFNLMALCLAYPHMAVEHMRCDQGGLRDTWQCLRCRRRYTDDQYRYAVGSEYIRSARSLTARELEWKTGVPASTIRAWGSMGRVTKRGRDDFGLWRYDVAQVEAKVAEYQAQVAAAAARAAARAKTQQDVKAG